MTKKEIFTAVLVAMIGEAGDSDLAWAEMLDRAHEAAERGASLGD